MCRCKVITATTWKMVKKIKKKTQEKESVESTKEAYLTRKSHFRASFAGLFRTRTPLMFGSAELGKKSGVSSKRMTVISRESR